MPVSIVIGGQYGSEGKGKVALHVAQQNRAAAVVRVGGPNSGHTGVDAAGKTWVLRQLPAASLAPDTAVILAAGSLIDPEILEHEVRALNLEPSRLIIDSKASVVLARHRQEERDESLVEKIGSTASGTGACLRERMSRSGPHLLACDHPYLSRYVHSFTAEYLRALLKRGERVVIEGTQGFGLSLWHTGSYPNCTSRDTTAASFLSETGLSPRDTDDIVLVLRSFPIRVGGNSGPLENEIDWKTVAIEARLPKDYVEHTSATKRVRRVGRFHADVVRRAIIANQPHRVVMNHMDYVDTTLTVSGIGARADAFLASVERQIDRGVDLVGISPNTLIERSLVRSRAEMRHATIA